MNINTSYPVHPKHWNYFLSVESDLINCSKYINFDKRNFLTFSNELAKIIMLSASEVESIFIEMCERISPNKTKKNRGIKDYHKILMEKHPDMINCEIEIPLHKIKIKPWDGWLPEKSPTWWGKGYNKIKHDRYTHMEQANLINTLNAVGAQFLAVLYYHREFYQQDVTVEMHLRSSLFSTIPPSKYKGGMFFGYGDPFAYQAEG